MILQARGLAYHFCRETLAQIWDEIQPLLHQHKDEVAHFEDIPLDPDRDLYFKMEALGMARIFTVRAASGDSDTLVGYAAYFVRPNLHYRGSLQAQQDVLFISREHRGFGQQFIAWCDKELAAEGVQVVMHHTKVKPGLNFGRMLARLGYEKVDEIWVRRLDK